MRKVMLTLMVLPVALAAQETCPTPWFWNSIGVDAFHCSGGTCASEMRVNGPGASFTFSAEPRLRALDPAGPSAGRLQEGDVLVAVNERLIVTAAGGAELGRLAADRDANITVRRGDRLLAVQLRPKHSCRPPTLLVGENVIESSQAARARTTAGEGAIALSGISRLQAGSGSRSLGISIRCEDCGYRVRTRQGAQNEISLMVGRHYPIIASIERGGMADRAGLRLDDELRRISGIDVLTEEGTPLLVTPPRGEFDIDIVRAGREQRIHVGPVNSVERRIDPDAPREIRVVRQGDNVRSDDLLGTVVRWWRSIQPEQEAPAMLVTRGEAWGDGDLGFLVGGDRLIWRHNTETNQESWSLERPLRVVEVIANSLAERAGLRKDDVITHANDLEVHTDAGARALLLTPRRNAVVLKVTRDGRELTVTIPPRAM